MNFDEAKERAAFEKWFTGDGKWSRAVEKNKKGEYAYINANTAWATWQASAKIQTRADGEFICRSCGLKYSGGSLEKFAVLVRAETKEECAKVCDGIEYDHYRDNKCATAIREMK